MRALLKRGELVQRREFIVVKVLESQARHGSDHQHSVDGFVDVPCVPYERAAFSSSNVDRFNASAKFDGAILRIEERAIAGLERGWFSSEYEMRLHHLLRGFCH